MIAPPTFEELFDAWKAEMSELGFNYWGEGSRIGAVGRVICGYLVDLWGGVAAVEEQTNLSTARGSYLDRFGEMFGVRRHRAMAATTLGQGPSVKFTNQGATAATVPVGTRLWNAAEPSLGFLTTRTLTVEAGGEGYADVTALSEGEAYNVGTGTLTSHNLGNGSVTVTNVRPIGGGTVGESDESYRFRIKEALLAKNGMTEVAIRQTLLRLPGVRDVFVQSGVRGHGSVDIMVIPVDRYLSADLQEAAEQALQEIATAGISWRVKGPKTRRIDATVRLRLQPGTTLAEVKPLVEGAVRGYLDNLRTHDGRGGSELIYHELISRIQDASPAVIDSQLSLRVDGLPTLQGNVTTKPGERLVSGAVSVL